MAEVKFLQLSPGWQKMHLKMHQIDALKYGIWFYIYEHYSFGYPFRS